MPVITIGRQFGAGGTIVGGMLARELKADLLESRIIDEVTQLVIKEAARAGNVIIVGRGGAYILSDFEGALHVFLRAAEAIRVKAVMARLNLSEEDARRRLKLTDENWTAYIK